ncbi:MAG TPA: hypothetical protein PKC54_10920 [Ferruginibacter sp.]|nr:hypothetical protein [Ferruginibacter sp.]
MNVSDEQVVVFSGLKNVELKVLIVKVFLGILIALTITLILLMTCIKSEWTDKAILGGIELFLGYIVKPMTDHFFPALKAAKNED